MQVPVLNLLKGGVKALDDRPISSISKRNSTGMGGESAFSNEMRSHRSNANESTNRDLNDLFKTIDKGERKIENSAD